MLSPNKNLTRHQQQYRVIHGIRRNRGLKTKLANNRRGASPEQSSHRWTADRNEIILVDRDNIYRAVPRNFGKYWTRRLPTDTHKRIISSRDFVYLQRRQYIIL